MYETPAWSEFVLNKSGKPDAKVENVDLIMCGREGLQWLPAVASCRVLCFCGHVSREN